MSQNITQRRDMEDSSILYIYIYIYIYTYINNNTIQILITSKLFKQPRVAFK